MKHVKLFEGFISSKKKKEEEEEEDPGTELSNTTGIIATAEVTEGKKLFKKESGKFFMKLSPQGKWIEISKAEYNKNPADEKLSEDVYNYKDIDKWDDKTVEKIYGYFLDELSNDKREAEEKKNLTVVQKREALKNKEKKFTHSFKK